MQRAFAPLFAVLLLCGCASAPAGDSAGLPAMPLAFKEIDRTASTTVTAPVPPSGAWWTAFQDPALNDLVERANQNNTSIQVAAARLAQARALVRGADADRGVQLGLNTAASRQGGPLVNAAGADGTLISTTANLSWEADLFGRLAKGVDAATLDARGSEALLQGARLMVQTDVAQTYFSLRALNAERGLLRASLADANAMIALAGRRFRSGLAAEMEVERQRSEHAAIEAEALALDRRRAEREHALALLLGEVASGFQFDDAAWSTPLPVIPAGIPSTVLARRPDVSAAQSAMRAAQARLGAARDAWFPSLTLTSAGGYASPDLGNLFRMSMRAWGISGLLAAPLLDGGRREAAVQGANATLDVALATYREQILVAFKEVEDQLSALRLLADQAEVQRRATMSAQRAATLTDSRYRRGLISQLDALLARRDELGAQRSALQVRSAQYQATVGLVRALGGSWESAGAPAAGS